MTDTAGKITAHSAFSARRFDSVDSRVVRKNRCIDRSKTTCETQLVTSGDRRTLTPPFAVFVIRITVDFTVHPGPCAVAVGMAAKAPVTNVTVASAGERFEEYMYRMCLLEIRERTAVDTRTLEAHGDAARLQRPG